MRRVRCVLVVLLMGLSAPAAAEAQSTVAQDLSIAGAHLGYDGANTHTFRFTVTNHGPGALDGVSVRAYVMGGPGARSVPPGCVEKPFIGHDCDLGTHFEQGEVRTLDFVFEFVASAFQPRGASGMLSLGRNMAPVSDANFANNSATVNLGLEFGPPGIHLDLQGADGGLHGATTLSQIAIRNTGVTRLTDIRATSDRCPESAQINERGQTALETASGFVIDCRWTIPPHTKGDERITETVTVTAKAAGDRIVTATATNTLYFKERRRACGSFRARRRTYGVNTTAADFTCAATRRVLKRCLTRHKRPKGFRCRVYPKGSAVMVSKPKREPNDRMIAIARR
jgi:hypothetical protein